MKTGERLEKKRAGSGQAQEAAQFFFTVPLAWPDPVFFTVPLAMLCVLPTMQSTAIHHRSTFPVPARHVKRNGGKKLAGGVQRNGEKNWGAPKERLEKNWSGRQERSAGPRNGE